MPLWLRYLQAAADVFQKMVAGSAIIIAGIFAYYRFFKERTYASRLEPTISGSAARKDGVIYLRAAANTRNIGQSRVNLNHEYIGLRILTRIAGSGDWTLYRIENVFEEQDYLEPGESVGEPVWIEVPDRDDITALRLDLYVAESEEVGWAAREVVNLVSQVDNKEESEHAVRPTEGQQSDVVAGLREGVRRWWHSRA